MLKTLLKDSVVYGIANAVQKLVPVFIIPLITGYLGQDALRIYDVSFVYAYIFLWLAILGQDAAASLLYFDQKKTGFQKKQMVAYALLLQLCCLAFFFLLFYFLSPLWTGILFAKDAALAGWWLKALNILPGHILLNFSLNLLLWQRRKSAYVLLCIIQTIVSIASIFIGLVVFSGGLAALFYCLVGSVSITGLVGIFLVRDQLAVSVFPVNLSLLKKLALLGLPFALTSFFHQLLPGLDRVFLLHYGYSSEMAPYILAAKLGALVSFATGAFVLAFTPYSLAKLNDEDAEKHLSQLFSFVAVGGFFLIPLLLLFKDWLITIFADNTYRFSAQLLPFFFFGWLFDLFSYFSTLGILRSQKSVLSLLLFAFGFIVVSVLNLLLIPVIGLYGAAIGFCGAKVILFFLSMAWLKRHFHLQLQPASFWISLALSAGCSYAVYVLPTLITLTLLALFFLMCFIFFKKQKLERLFTGA